MKDIRPALRTFMLANSTLSTLVGGERIYSIRAPQGVEGDMLVFYKISGSGDYVMPGGLTGLARQRIQIDAWAEDADRSFTLGDAVRNCIDGYRGLMGSGGNQVAVQGVFLLDQGEDYDGEAELFRNRADYAIFFEDNS